jgi:uncharacterized protein YhfF
MSRSIGLHLPKSQIALFKPGETYTTCQPKERTEKIDSTHISRMRVSVGQTFQVADEKGAVQAEVKLLNCFMTTFGSLDPEFVAGMGFGTNIEKCKIEYAKFWQQAFPGEPLIDATELFVTIWQFI